MNALRYLFKILFWSLLIWLFFRAFVFQTFRIPSSSMYGTLFEDDFVVINKLAYGPRLPITPLSLKVGGNRKYVDWIQLPAVHLFGYSDIQRNDVLAFNYDLLNDKPVDMQEEYIKRCVALPGDTLKIVGGNVFINAQPAPENFVFNTYHAVYAKTPDSTQFKNEGIIQAGTCDETGNCVLLMTNSKARSLSTQKNVKSLVKDAFSHDYYDPAVYPHASEFRWNYDFYGPVWIPRKGDSILLNRSTAILYRRCIESYEKESVMFKNDTAFVSGKAAKYYCFKQNYYFLLGDNRHNSIDCRKTGFIPQSHIIGKASFILYSSSRSGRGLKRIE